MNPLDWIRQNIIQPIGNEAQQIKPSLQAAQGFVGNQINQGVNFLNNRIQSGQGLIPEIPDDYSDKDTSVGRVRSFILGALNSPAQVINQGVINPTADVSNNFSALQSGSPLQYQNQLSSVGRLGMQLGGNGPQSPLDYVKNLAGVASPIINAEMIPGAANAAEAGFNASPLWQQVAAGAAKNAAIGGAAGAAQGFASPNTNTWQDALGQVIPQATAGAITGGFLGGGSALAGGLAKGAINLGQEYAENGGIVRPAYLGNEDQAKIANIQSNPLLSDAEKQSEIGKIQQSTAAQPNVINTLRAAQESGLAKPIESPRTVLEAQQPNPPEITDQSLGTDTKGQARAAISAKLAAEDQIKLSAQIAQQSAHNAGLVGPDAELFRDTLEHPEDLQKNLSQVSDQGGFMEALNKYRGFTNDVYAVSKNSGRDYPFRSNYYNHEYDLTELKNNPQAAAEYGDFVNQRTQSNASSKSEIPRVFNDLREANGYGDYLQNKYGLENNPFQQKNESVVQDIHDLSARSQRVAGASAFVQRLKEVAPGQVAIGNEETIPQGFLQLWVPGLQDTFVSPELHKQLSVLEPSAFQDNPVIQMIDKANRGLKGLILQGPFHAIKESINFAGDQLGQLKLPNFIQSAQVAGSPTAFTEYLSNLKDSGLLDIATKANLKLGGTDYEDLNNTELSMKSMTFGRLIPYYKLESFKTAIERTGIDVNTPEGLSKAQAIASQVNNFYGGLQNELNGRNKTVQQLLRLGTLAPDFNEGKIRTGINAALSWDGNGAGGLARRQLIGSLAVTALATEIGRRLSTGKWDDLKSLLQNTVLDPNIPLPSQFNKPGSNIQQTVNLPASVAGDLYRLATNPRQAIQSRGGSLLSAADKVVTGKDYYGNPLVNPFQNPNPTMWDNAKALVTSGAELPIPLQNAVSAAQGKISPSSAIVNTIGGRVGNNPNDPKQIANTQYFNNLATFTKSLNPNEQSLFGTLNPTKKDQDGNPVFDKSAITSGANAAELASQPAFAQKYAQFQIQNGSIDPIYKLQGNILVNALQARATTALAGKSALDPNAPSVGKTANDLLQNFSLFQGQQALQKLSGAGNYDPLYDLSDSQAKQVLYVRAQNALGTSGDPKETAIKAQDWYKPFIQQEQQFYTAHPIPAQPNQAPSTAPVYPTMPANLQQYAQYISGLSTPALKAQAYNTPQGQQLDQYYNQLDQYNSQKGANLLGTSLNVAAGKYTPGYIVNPANPTGTSLNLPASGSTSTSGTSVSQALATSAMKRGARRIISSMNKTPSTKRSKVKIPKLTSSKVTFHGKVTKPTTSGFSSRPIGKVRRPSPRLA